KPFLHQDCGSARLRRKKVYALAFNMAEAFSLAISSRRYLMSLMRFAAALPCFIALTSLHLYGQSTASSSNSQPDVLIFTNGEKLIGHLESATGKSVVFKSDMAGEVTVDWSKIQELHSSQKFAAIPKGTRLRNSQDAARVPQGTVAVTNQQVQVSPSGQAAPVTVPVGNVGNLVEDAAFQKAFERSSFFHGWTG